MELIVDEFLLARKNPEVGIPVRAKSQDGWGSFDISVLDEPSLLVWLRSRGGKNEWAENIVALLLHGESFDEKVFRFVEDRQREG